MSNQREAHYYRSVTGQSEYPYRNLLKYRRTINDTETYLDTIFRRGYMDILRILEISGQNRSVGYLDSINYGYRDVFEYLYQQDPNLDLDIPDITLEIITQGHLSIFRDFIGRYGMLYPDSMNEAAALNPYIFKYLLKQAGLEPIVSILDTLMEQAIVYDNFPNLQELFRRGANPANALELAVINRRTRVFRYLIRLPDPRIEQELSDRKDELLQRSLNNFQFDIARELIDRTGVRIDHPALIRLIQFANMGDRETLQFLQYVVFRQYIPLPNIRIFDPHLESILFNQFPPTISGLLSIRNRFNLSEDRIRESNFTLFRLDPRMDTYDIYRTIAFTGDLITREIIPRFPYRTSSHLAQSFGSHPATSGFINSYLDYLSAHPMIDPEVFFNQVNSYFPEGMQLTFEDFYNYLVNTSRLLGNH